MDRPAYCPNCGSPTTTSFSFCSNCGRSFKSRSTATNSALGRDALYTAAVFLLGLTIAGVVAFVFFNERTPITPANSHVPAVGPVDTSSTTPGTASMSSRPGTSEEKWLAFLEEAENHASRSTAVVDELAASSDTARVVELARELETLATDHEDWLLVNAPRACYALAWAAESRAANELVDLAQATTDFKLSSVAPESGGGWDRERVEWVAARDVAAESLRTTDCVGE
jgi:hypothetical protein